jgi:RNA polymerase sigma-70 factor, ECF subfamily
MSSVNPRTTRTNISSSHNAEIPAGSGCPRPASKLRKRACTPRLKRSLTTLGTVTESITPSKKTSTAAQRSGAYRLVPFAAGGSVSTGPINWEQLVAVSPLDVETDAMLVFAAQDGDADAFSELFRRHYQTVRRACARRLRDIREADEVAQAAFVRAYERLDRCTGDRRFGAWVQVIANNLCVDHMRASARTTPSDEIGNDSTDPIENAPEHAVLRAEQRALIQRALADLPDRQRDVVVARDVDGRRPPEIAAALGLSLGAVDSLLLRARRRLAASVQAMSTESGAASAATTAAVSAVGGGVAHIGTLSRFAQSVSDAIASASYHIAATMGIVPGMPSFVAQAGPAAAAAGAIALAPFGVGAPSTHVTPPAVPPISATVAGIPAAPTAPSTSTLAPNTTTIGVPQVSNPATPEVPTDRSSLTTSSAPVAPGQTGGVLGSTVELLTKTIRADK